MCARGQGVCTGDLRGVVKERVLATGKCFPKQEHLSSSIAYAEASTRAPRPKILKRLDRIKSVCLRFAAATAELLGHIDDRRAGLSALSPSALRREWALFVPDLFSLRKSDRLLLCGSLRFVRK